VTRASLREYATVQRERYQHATRAEKHRLLNELVTVTGLHRKAAIRLLRRAPRPATAPSRAGRPRCYGPDVAAAAAVLWQASGRIGAHRRHPFVAELLERLLRCGELTVAPAVEKLVRQASRPTFARLLELEVVWGKGQTRVGSAVHYVRERLPVPLVGLDSDNGSEFINHRLYTWCQREGISFTRSRAYHKKRRAHVEQKNGAVVRRLVGYDRFASRAAYAQLARVYQLARWHVNFFQPVEKLVTKTRTAPDPHRPQGSIEPAPPSPKPSPGAVQTMASVTLNYELTRTGG
jgi:hypothetical protein